MTDMPEALIFDLDGTLILRDARSPLERLMEGLRDAHRIFIDAGVPLPDFRTTFAMVHQELTRRAAGLAYGNFREAAIPDLVSGFIRKAFPDLPDAVLVSALDAWYAPMATSARPAPGAVETLSVFKGRGIRLGAAGNSPWGSRYARQDLERAGLSGFFDVVLCSADVGFRKPNLFLISETLRRLNVPADRAWHVGDDPREDVEAPQELGLLAVVLAPPGTVPRADQTVCALSELPGLIDRVSHGAPASPQ